VEGNNVSWKVLHDYTSHSCHATAEAKSPSLIANRKFSGLQTWKRDWAGNENVFAIALSLQGNTPPAFKVRALTIKLFQVGIDLIIYITTIPNQIRAIKKPLPPRKATRSAPK